MTTYESAEPMGRTPSNVGRVETAIADLQAALDTGEANPQISPATVEVCIALLGDLLATWH
jgi:hypothetical protein